MSVQIITGDCRNELAKLADESVNCVVTSPPYFGLRDYGVDGQIGLEDTPDAFVAELVSVFRDVRRVLRKDGTLWLNLGDSYASSTKGTGGSNPETSPKQSWKGSENGQAFGAVRLACGLPDKNLIGIPWRVAFALQQPWTDWQIKSEAMRAWVAGIVDGEGCITILRTKSSHSESLSFPPAVQVRMCDREPLERLVDVAGSSLGKPQSPPSHKLANQRDSYQWKLVSDRAAKVIAEIYPFLTCKRKQAIVAWNHQMFRAARGNQERKAGELEREEFCKALINDLNQRKAVDLPSWMIEPRIVQEPGWYLRQDLIWSKPNPMPESVQDRCTKAHEYVFLLSKSPRYHYDAEAIAEPVAPATVSRLAQDVESQQGSNRVPGKTNGAMKAVGRASGNKAHKYVAEYEVDDSEQHRTKAGLLKIAGTAYETRNARSVWAIATQPFSEAHFATFPPELAERCIKAGCPEGGTVLDPFGGAGTTGMVADRLQRNAILIELNPAYAEIARNRIFKDAGMFAEIAS